MITGGMKFFEPSKILFALGHRAVASSGGASSNNALSENRTSFWESADSTDATEETLEVTLSEPVRINRILLMQHNFKDFRISISGVNEVTDINNQVLTTDSEGYFNITNNEINTSYFSFGEALVLNVSIKITATLTPNENKILRQLVATEEIATFLGFPEIAKIDFDMNESKTKTKAGLSLIHI